MIPRSKQPSCMGLLSSFLLFLGLFMGDGRCSSRYCTLSDGRYNMNRAFLPLVPPLPPSTSCHAPPRWMEDPQVMHRVRNELESAASLGVYATPTAVLNGIHMMRLVGADQLRNFELFIDRGMAPQPLYQVGGASVWASVEGGATGGEGTNHGITVSYTHLTLPTIYSV